MPSIILKRSSGSLFFHYTLELSDSEREFFTPAEVNFFEDLLGESRYGSSNEEFLQTWFDAILVERQQGLTRMRLGKAERVAAGLLVDEDGSLDNYE